jgi:hypothetical protein
MPLSNAQMMQMAETIRNAPAARLKTAAISMFRQVSQARVDALDSPSEVELAWSAYGGEIAAGAFWWALTGQELPGAGADDDGVRETED